MIKRLLALLLLSPSLSAAVSPLRTMLVDTNYNVSYPTNIRSIPIGGSTFTNLTGNELVNNGGSLGVSSNVLLTTIQTLTDSQIIVHRQNTGNAGIEDVSGSPNLTSRDGVVANGCYIDPAGGPGFGMNGAVSSHTNVAFVNMGNDSRVNTSGDITEIEFYVTNSLPANCQIKIHIWRETDVRWELIASTGDLRSLLAATNGVERIVLPNPLQNVQIGDCIGGELIYVSGSWGAGFCVVDTPQVYVDWTSRNFNWAYSPRMESGAPWDLATVNTGQTIPIRVYGKGPVWTILGDSRGAGYPYTQSLINPTQNYDKNADMAYRLERIVGRPVRNVSWQGYSTGEMLLNFTNYVINANTRGLILLPGAYNNIYNSPSNTIAYYTNEIRIMIDSALTNGVQYVVVASDYPFWDSFAPGTNGVYGSGWTCIQGQASDDFSAGSKYITELYPSSRVRWVDLRPDLGQVRPDWGDPYWQSLNLWDLKELFIADLVTDRLHMSPAGADQTMRTIGRELRSWLKAAPAATQEARPLVLSDAGDADVTVSFTGAAVTILPYDTLLSTDRTVTLNDGLVTGDIFRLLRTELSTNTIDVGGLKTVPTNQPAMVEAIWYGSSWKLSGYQAF